MEAPEVPIDEVREHLDHHAHEEGSSFVSSVALSTAVLAAFAAVASLLAGDHANEAMVSQIESSDKWAYYQAKSIKAAVLTTKIALLETQGKKATAEDEKKMEEYKDAEKDIGKEANALTKEAKEHLGRHKRLAFAVTLLQIAIAIGAISALTKRKPFWFVSLLFGAAGVGLLICGLFLPVAAG